MYKIVNFIKLPPPITGATLINQHVKDSRLLNENFNIHTIGISYSKNICDLGKRSFSKFLIFYKSWLRLLKALIFFKPDLIYFQISPLGVAFIRDLFYVTVMKIFKIKIVFHLHGKGIKEQAKIKWKRILYIYAFCNSDIICLSKLLTYDVEGVFKGRVHIVNNGIPDIDDTLLKLSQDNKNDEIKLLYLSNLIVSKGILDFIESLYLLNQKGLNFQAEIVGADGTLSANDLQEIIFSKNLSNRVQYLGAKYEIEKHRVLAQSDVLVFPTKNDAFPGVVLEAMQFSLPIISTKEGAIPEMITDGVSGFLVEKDSPAQIAEKLEILINNSELRARMGAAGRKKYLENYTIDKFEANMKNVFDDILKRQKATA